VKNLLGVVAFIVAAGATALGGCSQDRELPARRPITALPEPDDSQALDEDLMIALAQAKNFHHKADVYMQEGKTGEATEALRQILAVPFPESAPEGEDVLLDARARLAKLLLAGGQTEEALAVVEQGIGAARRRSFFLANLNTVKGEVHEAMAISWDQEGGEEAASAAAAARRDAIEAFDESIHINRALQEALVNEGAR
jgi:tetratricopeptide (TPR) repeat protein